MQRHRTCKRILAGLLAAAACLPAMSALNVQAATEQRLTGYRGDVNGDMQVDITDVQALLEFLHGGGWADNIDRADLDQNGRLNGIDLTLMKRIALGLSEPEGIYEEVEIDDPPAEEELMEAPIKTIKPSLPSTGHNRLLVVIVEFPDKKFSETLTAEKLKANAFGPQDPSSSAYPNESVTGYYERASYGALTMDADVYYYTAQGNASDYRYVWPSGSVFPDANKLGEEILSALDSEIDYNNYDVNADGVMDSMIVTVPDTCSNDDWWPASHTYSGSKKYDGVQPYNIIIGNTDPRDRAEYNCTWIHELGHAMGLPDYYKYENTQDGYYGLNGPAGMEMMDDARGDMCAFSKLMYGWYKPSQVHVYEGGTQTYTLQSSQVAANCIVIPRGDVNNYLSEYMILEYATQEGNNDTWWYFDSQTSGGLRVLHVEATAETNYWGGEFKWNNYSSSYDSSNTKQRVLRLANESEGGKFFTAGQTVDGNVSGFHWYDGSGYQTVDTGVKITVDSVADGVMTVTISQT